MENKTINEFKGGTDREKRETTEVIKFCKTCGDETALKTLTDDYKKLREVYVCSCGADGNEVNFWPKTAKGRFKWEKRGNGREKPA